MLGVITIDPGGDCNTTDVEVDESDIRLFDPEPCITGIPWGDDCGS